MALLPDKAALVAYNADTEQAAIDRAVALIENHICPGVPGILTAATRAVTLRLLDEPRGFEAPALGEYRISARRLRAWPITALVSVIADGADITSECAFNRFGITRSKLGAPFTAVSSLVVTFKTGFEDPMVVSGTLIPLPKAIQQAILSAASTMSSNPNGVRSEKYLDTQIVYNDDFGSAINAGSSGVSGAAAGLPMDVQAMLAPWRLEVY